MQFTSLSFLIFLLITYVVYNLVPNQFRYIILAIGSTVFYFIGCGKLLLLLFSIALITYIAGRQYTKKYTPHISVTLLVLILAVFKYSGFLYDTIMSIMQFFGGVPSERMISIALPLGISFYTFEAISYIIDCRNGKIVAERNFLYVYTYLVMFPTVVSGPIERAGNIIPQLKHPKSVDLNRFMNAVMLIMWGFALKLLLADRLAIFVDNVYSNPGNYAGTIVFFATVFYSFEIYADFAGYTAIAIGAGLMLGIDLSPNFDTPYLSSNISEFWRRWHISLSSWLRDYLYIPLGGNRRGEARKLLNLVIVFTISGLWHGAAWTFAFWGLLHGLYQVVSSVAKVPLTKVKQYFEAKGYSSFYHVLQVIITFLMVNFAWIFFRADTFSNATDIIKGTFSVTPWVFLDGSFLNVGLSRPDMTLMLIVLAILVLTDILNRHGIYIRKSIICQPLIVRWTVMISVIIIIATCGIWGPGYSAGNFIYSGF